MGAHIITHSCLMIFVLFLYLYYHNFGRPWLSILFQTVIIMLIIADVIILQANNTYSIETEATHYRLNDRMHTALI